MKNVMMMVVALSMVGMSSYAGDGHKHGKNEKAAHSHKDEKCKECKKDEKECNCHEKDKKDEHGHSEEKKDSK